MRPPALAKRSAKAHQVRLIDRAREGKPAHKWPDGTFEIHRLPDGELCLAGYVSPMNETRLYSDTYGEAAKLLSTRVASAAPADSRLHREPGNPITLRYS